MKAFFIALFLGICCFCICYLVIMTKILPKSKVRERVRVLQFGEALEKADGMTKLEDIPFAERVFVPVFKSFSDLANQLAPKALRNILARRIMRAGKQNVWSVNSFVAGWMISFFGCSALVAFLLWNSQMQTARRIAIMVVGVLFGAGAPLIFLDSLIQRRAKAIQRELPEILDLLCVSVQAGLSFDGSIANIVTRMNGPFIEECKKMLSDVRMGMSRRVALKNLAKRCDVEEVYLFTTSVIQSEKLGSNLSTTLVNQADNMRERRRQYVKAEALKAPIKMLFPLIIFIFPALFIVVLLPAGLSLMKNFHM